MLHFILGRAGSGKSTRIRSLLKEYADAGVKGMTLIVPEQASFASEREMLRLLGPRDVEKVDVLSFTRLAETVVSHSARKKLPKIDDGGRAVLMSMALESVAERLNVYKRHGKSLSVVKELLQISEEFKRCAVTTFDLLKASGAMEQCLLKDKLYEVSVILEAYDALIAQRFEDDRDLLTLLCGELPESGFFKGSVVAIDAFSGFTRQEYMVIERMLSQASEVYVTLCTDDIFGGKGGAFEYIKSTAAKLISAANRAGVPVAAPEKLSNDDFYSKPEELEALDRRLFAADAKVYEGCADAITVCYADSVYDECSYIAAEIKRLLREEGYRSREIAVIARDAGRYEAELKSAMMKCGVPVFEDRRQPIVNQPLITLIRAAADIAANGYNCDRVMRFLKTNLTGIPEEDICELENYALMWDISGDRWVSDWDDHPDGFGVETTSESLDKVEKINKIRSKATAPVDRLRRSVSDADGKEFSAAIYKMLEELDVGENLKKLAVYLEEIGEPVLALEQERVWEMAMDMLDLIFTTVEKSKLPPRRFAELLDIIIGTKTFGSIPQGLDETAIGSADRIVTSSPRVVFVVGSNDGVFPKDPVMRGILNDADRKKLQDVGLELYDFGEYRVVSERFLVYKTLCAASEKLYVTYPLADFDGSAAAPSEFVLQIKRLFPNAAQHSAALSAQNSLPEGVAPAFEYMCLNMKSGGEVYTAVRSWLGLKEEYGAKLAALERIAENQPFEISDTDVSRKLFGDNLYVSASKIETYFSCPFKYFCKYGIFAKPDKKAKFDPSQQGSEIHFVLETIIRACGKDGLLSMTPDERASEVSRLLNEYLSDRLSGGEKNKRFEYLYRRLSKTLCEVLERLVLEFGVSSFEPVDFELNINKYGDIEPYEIKLDSGETVCVTGRVDRVDKFDDGDRRYLRIIDYKSGGKTFLLSDVLNGLNLQMLVYLFAIWKNGEGRYGGKVVPSGILYMPAKAAFKKVERDAEDDEISLQKAKSLKMDGMLLKDELAITAMDNTGGGVFIPAYFTKTGILKGTLITLEQLERLRAAADKLICEMASALHGGLIPALPAKIKGDEKSAACAYCEYKSVCRHEDGLPVREIDGYNHEESLKILDSKEAEKDVDD
ncbi:MAG: hypothetical protein GX107_03360 [Clostridiales bacterium]|jgi:ATP-dependent helicase/nuclease subunit B|nr:hypothetical protein [Clostridiales bacterium]